MQYKVARTLPKMPERLSFEPRLFFLIALEALALTLISLAVSLLSIFPSNFTTGIEFVGGILFSLGMVAALLTHDLPQNEL